MIDAEYAVYLRELVEQASLADPDRNIFGAGEHRYHLNTVLSLEDVRMYEKKYNIQLPSEYVFFITQVGNGGAGPYSGIHALDLNQPACENMGLPFITSRLTYNHWTEKLTLVCSAEELGEYPDDICEQIESEIYQGTYVISTPAVGYQIIALTDGEEENRIFYLDTDWRYDGMPYDTKMTFLQWYETYFREIIAGNCVDSYGTRMIKTEEELIEEFGRTDDVETGNKILNSFLRFLSPTPQTIEFFHTLPIDRFPEYKLSLLLRYDTETGIRLFEQMLETNPEAALANSMLVPKNCLPKYYEKLLQLLYEIENGSEKKYRYLSLHDILLYRLGECPQLQAQDVLMFLEKADLTDDDIKTALYTMGLIPDKTDAIDTFAHFLKNGSYWVAYTALQAVCHTLCPKLKPVYQDMWKRYHEDPSMLTNLKIAFRRNGMRLPRG